MWGGVLGVQSQFYESNISMVDGAAEGADGRHFFPLSVAKESFRPPSGRAYERSKCAPPPIHTRVHTYHRHPPPSTSFSISLSFALFLCKPDCAVTEKASPILAEQFSKA